MCLAIGRRLHRLDGHYLKEMMMLIMLLPYLMGPITKYIFYSSVLSGLERTHCPCHRSQIWRKLPVPGFFQFRQNPQGLWKLVEAAIGQSCELESRRQHDFWGSELNTHILDSSTITIQWESQEEQMHIYHHCVTTGNQWMFCDWRVWVPRELFSHSNIRFSALTWT